MEKYSYQVLPNGQANAVYGVDISPADDMIASVSLSHAMKIWDKDSDEPREYRDLHADGIADVCFSPDGKLIATAGLDRLIKVFDTSSGTIVTTLSGSGNFVMSVSFMGDDNKKLVSTGFDNMVRTWTLDGPVAQLAGMTNYSYGVDCSADGRWIVSGSVASEVTVWNSDGEKTYQQTEHEKGVHSVAFAKHSNDKFASGGGDGVVSLWNREAGEVANRLRGHKGYVRALAFSHDGKMLASGGQDGAICLWDLEKLEKLQTLSLHTNTVYSLAFSHDDSFLVSGSFDRRTVKWQL